MLIIQSLWLMILLIVLPCILGWILCCIVSDTKNSILFYFTIGQVAEWAVFQLIAVPCILLKREFQYVVILFSVFLLISLSFFFIVFFVKERVWKITCIRNISVHWNTTWFVFALVVFYQIYKMCSLAFADGDDAYYVATATITEESNTMYIKLPYTGGATELDIRHGLAPFPVWIAYLGRITGIHTATISHVFLPIAVLLLTYSSFALIGKRLVKRENLSIFMLLASLLVMFGNYSFKTTETFLLTRTSQGKAVLGNVIIPITIYIIMRLYKCMEEKKDNLVHVLLFLFFSVTSACLCSALGGTIIILFLGLSGMLGGILYKKWSVCTQMLIICIPAFVFVIIYLFAQGA